ncbi:MAG TPA: ABC transporter permease [Fimbriimonas sp.]|nr:ABC transporter permease [Fimbriimonas sp.]
MNFARIKAVARKEWKELTRDRIFLSLAFLLPAMMMMLFGYAMSRDVENVPLSILDLDRSSASRDFSRHFTDSRYFRFKGYLKDMREAQSKLDDGTLRVVIVIPDRFEQRIDQGLPADVQPIFDGAITISVRTIRGYVEAIIGAASADVQQTYLAKRMGVSPQRTAQLMQPLRLETRYLYNEEIKSIWIMAPALVMIIMMWIVPILMSVSVVREKETGSIYNIYSSSIKRSEFILGKLAPIVLIAAINGFLLWMLAVFYFQAPFRGNAIVFSVAVIAYAASICGLGLLASLFVRTQQAALLAAVIMGAVVAMNYSGVFTPIAEMGPSTAFISHLFPAMYFNRIVEGTFLKSASFAQLEPDLLTLLFYPVAMFGFANLLFKKVVAG